MLALRQAAFVATYICLSCIGQAQCPPNLGFEEGSFNHWKCYTNAYVPGDTIDPPVAPITTRHALLKNNTNALDFYGKFPVNCPNGSGYSIKLGNENVGAESERVSYTFTIPADQDVFSLIYNYAVVFEDPGHEPHEQPRFTAKVFDVDANHYIECSSFDYAARSDLPGFQSGVGTVQFKPWSQVTVKLVGYAGKKIRLDFTTYDCSRGGHFGYAYLDIEEDCTSPIKGNTVCEGMKAITLTAPFGFKDYNWYDSSFSSKLGTGNTLRLSPPPAAGTKYALQVIPYPGSGCVDTLYTTIIHTPVPFSFRLVDSIAACLPGPLDLTQPGLKQGSTPGLQYSYFLDSTEKERVPLPSMIKEPGEYYIKAGNSSGCNQVKPVKAILRELPSFAVKNKILVHWPGTADITDPALRSGNTQGIQFSYWSDPATTNPLPSPDKISQTATYFIKGTNGFGCKQTKAVAVEITPPPPSNAFSPNGDGINDTWQIPGLKPYPYAGVRVYNRWGQLVFQSIGYTVPWNGKYNGEILNGTYYYVIDLAKGIAPLRGSVTILR